MMVVFQQSIFLLFNRQYNQKKIEKKLESMRSPSAMTESFLWLIALLTYVEDVHEFG